MAEPEYPPFGQPGWRAYQPAGFTRSPAVRAILDPYEDRKTGLIGGLCHFEGLPIEDAARLLALLPPAQAEEAQNAAPSFGELVTLLRDYPGTTVHGYRIVPERGDERITLEGFLVPITGWNAQQMHDLLRHVGQPDESYITQKDDEPYLFTWWD